MKLTGTYHNYLFYPGLSFNLNVIKYGLQYIYIYCIYINIYVNIFTNLNIIVFIYDLYQIKNIINYINFIVKMLLHHILFIIALYRYNGGRTI